MGAWLRRPTEVSLSQADTIEKVHALALWACISIVAVDSNGLLRTADVRGGNTQN